MKKFEQIIVDLDGTLIEESARLEAQASAVADKFGSSHEAMQAVVDAFFAANDRAVAEGGADKNNIPLYMRWMGEMLGVIVSEEESLRLAHVWKKAYDESFQAPILFNDTVPFLAGLAERGYEPIIATGGSEEIKRKLMQEAGIDEQFKNVFAADEIGFQKQDIRFWNEVLQRLAVTPDKVVVVGNQINDDIWRTSELGMVTILIKRPEILQKNLGPSTVKPTHEVAHLYEALALL